MIAFSAGNIFQDTIEDNMKYTWIALGLLMVPILLLSFKTIFLKYFLAYKGNQVNVSAFYNFYFLI